MKSALAEDFDFLKNELQALKTEVKNNTAVIQSEIDQMKTTIQDMETGISTWSDEVVRLQDKIKDMEGRSRRCNIRILLKLLREVLQLDKDVLTDRSHRGLAPRKPGGKP